MKKIIWIIFLLLFKFQMDAQQSPADLGVAAIGLVVSDINKSEAFYTEIVGMVPAGEFSLNAEWSREAGAAGGKPFSVKMFKMRNAPSATVLKLAYFEHTDHRPEQNGIHSFSGVNYLTFHFGELATVKHRVEKAGIEILGWVKRENYQLFFIRDPDGVFIELVGPPDP